MSIEFKNDRYKSRLADFKKMLVQELNFTQEEVNFKFLEKFKLWKIEYRKYIEVDLYNENDHCVYVRCYEMDKIEHEFRFNIYKGSPSDFNNTKSIMRSLVLF